MKNNSKRICALLLAIVMCITCVVPVFAETDVHTHAEEGKCPGAGKYHTEENCTWNPITDDDVYDPGCGTLGYTKFTCSVCGDNFLDRWVPAEGGCDYDKVATEPVCNKDGSLVDGYLTITCKTHTDAKPQIVTVSDSEKVWKEWGYNREDFIAKHSYTDKQDSESCLEGGKKWEECTVCGHVKNEQSVGATGHDYKNVGFIDEDGNDATPTCLADGKAKYVCDNCGDVKYVVVEKTSDDAKHSYNEKDIVEVIAPDCDTPGKGEVDCTACGKKVEVELAAKGHTEETIKGTPATCTADGLTDGVKCSVCNTVITEQKPDPMIKHDMKEVDGSRETLIDASFKYNQDGKYACGKYDVWTEKCAVCGHEESKNTTPAAHNKGADPEIIESTCYSFGFKIYACTECGDPSVSEPIAKKDHTWSAWEEITPAGCETEGLKSRYCTVCKAAGVDEDKIGYEEEPIPAGQHDWVKDEDASYNSTCTVKGLLVEYCSKDCGVKNKETVLDLDLKGHDWDLAEKYEATAKSGEQHYIFLAKAPTCEDYGREALVCPYCDAVESRPVDFIGHDYIIYDNSVNADKNPTCQAEGGYYMLCANECGKGDYVAAHDLPTDHDKYDAEIHQIISCDTNGEYNETPATCLVAGLKTWKCSMCLEVSKTETIPALEHEWSEEIYTQLPKCDGTEGFTYRVCANGTSCDAYGAVISDKAILKVADIAPDFDENKEHHLNAIIKPDTIYYNGVRYADAAAALAAAKNGDMELLGLVRVGSCEFAPVYDMECVGCKLAAEGEDAYGFYHHEIGAFEHTYSDLNKADAPTCTADGKIAYYTCTVCGHYFAAVATDDAADADGFVPGEDLGKNPDLTDKSSGHDLSKPVSAKDPECTVNGVVAHYECGNCGKLIAADGNTVIEAEDTVVDMLGHKFELVEADPSTCTEDGTLAHYKCTVCGKFFASNIDVEDDKYSTNYVDAENLKDEKDGHSYKVVETVDASCEAPGYVRYSCEACGDIDHKVIDEDVDYIDGYKIPTGHTPVDVDDVAPTCTIAGRTGVVKCSVCNEILDDGDEIPAGHRNKDNKEIKEACGDETEDRVCVNPGCPFNGEPIPAHNFKVTNYEANCVQYEYTLYVCTTCGHWEVDENIKAGLGEHDQIEYNIIEEADCTKTGSKQLVCKRCGEVLGEVETIEKTAHKFGDWTEAKPAEIGVAGKKVRECEYGCKTLEEEDIPAITGIEFKYEIYNARDTKAAFVNSGMVAFKISMNAYGISLNNIYLAFEYDVDVLEYAGCQKIFNAFEAQKVTINGANGVATVNYLVGDDLAVETVSTEGEFVDFAIIEFKINPAMTVAGLHEDVIVAGAEKGFVSSVSTYNENGEAVLPTVDTIDFGTPDKDITINKLCDASGDGVFSGTDAAICLELVKTNGARYLAEADVDKNGKIELQDYLAIVQLLNQSVTYENTCK